MEGWGAGREGDGGRVRRWVGWAGWVRVSRAGLAEAGGGLAVGRHDNGREIGGWGEGLRATG